MYQQINGLEIWTRGAKVGIHAMSSGVEWIHTAIKHGLTFPVVKSVDNIGALADVHTLMPGAKTIARFEIDGEIGEGLNGLDAVAVDDTAELRRFADTLMAPIKRELTVNPASRDYVDYWEVCNEPAYDPIEGWINLARVMQLCIKQADALGIKLGLFGFNLGEPEWFEMVAIVETGVFSEAKKGGHILTWHDGAFGDTEIRTYYGGGIPFTVEDYKMHNAGRYEEATYVQLRSNGPHFITGASNVDDSKGIAGALSTRYRFLYWMLEQRDEVVPLVISEGYTRYDGGFFDALTWHDNQLSRDYYLWCQTPFTLGSNPQNGESARDYESKYPQIIDYMISMRERNNALPKAPIEPPVEVPMTEYEIGKAMHEQNEANWPLLAKVAIENGDTPYLPEFWRMYEGRQRVSVLAKRGDRRVSYWMDVPADGVWRESEVKEYDPEALVVVPLPEPPVQLPDVHEIHDVVDSLPKHPTKRYQTRDKTITHIAIHHSAGPGTATAQSIAQFHIGPSRDWPGIAYHYFIDGLGDIFKTNHHETMSYHVGGHNGYSLGICIDGTFTNRPPSDAQVDALRWLLDKLTAQIPTVTVVQAHKKFPNQSTSCCGDLRLAWYQGVEVLEDSVSNAAVIEPETIDLTKYMIGDGRTYELLHDDGGQERVQTQRSENRFWYVKGENSGLYEALWYDSEHIWRGIDTSPGHDAYYIQREAGEEGARWVKRKMAIGEVFVGAGHYVQFYHKANCAEIAASEDHHFAPNSGPATNQQQFVAVHGSHTFPTGITLSNVIELAGVSKNINGEWVVTGERMWFAQGFGLVGWASAWGGSYISEIHGAGERPDIEREQIACLGGAL